MEELLYRKEDKVVPTSEPKSKNMETLAEILEHPERFLSNGFIKVKKDEDGKNSITVSNKLILALNAGAEAIRELIKYQKIGAVDEINKILTHSLEEHVALGKYLEVGTVEEFKAMKALQDHLSVMINRLKRGDVAEPIENVSQKELIEYLEDYSIDNYTIANKSNVTMENAVSTINLDMTWHEIKGYNYMKDYNCQDESVNLPELEEELLISFQDDVRPNRPPFVGYFKKERDGHVRIIISANDGMSFVEVQDGVKWARFNRPKDKFATDMYAEATSDTDVNANLGLISREDVLVFIEDIKCNKDIPKNYGTLLDIMRYIIQMPAIAEETGRAEIASEKEETSSINWEIATKLMRCFPKSFINHNGEFIAHKETNEYCNLTVCKSELDVKCKVIECFSRGASKTASFYQESKNQKFNKFMRDGVNTFLSTSFTEEEMLTIYTRLGNCCNHSLTVEFVNSGYDMSLLAD